MKRREVPSSPAIMLAAMGIAVAVHMGSIVSSNWETTVEIEAGAGASIARLGTSFADMSAGQFSAQTPTETLNPATPQEVLAAQRPTPITTETAADTGRRITPSRTLGLTAPLASTRAARPDPTPVNAAAQPMPVVPPVMETLAPIASQDTLMATDETTRAPSSSPRPASRNPQAVPPEMIRPEPQRRLAAPEPTPRASETGTLTNQQGQTDGDRQNTSPTTGTATATAQQSGNAAASSYPGQVMRQLSRAGRPRLSARGAATIAFTIAANGRVASVSVAHSSGSQQLDRAAQRLVQRAGPFPLPPPGATRSFSVEIKGR